MREPPLEPDANASSGPDHAGFSDQPALGRAERSDFRRGMLYGIAAYGSWGIVVPIYIRALTGVPPLEILAHRVLWSVVMLAGLITWLGRWGQIARVARRPTAWAALACSASLVGVNWLVFIHAVVTQQIKEASLGYFLNPLVSIALGVVFLGERLSGRQWACIALAAAGVGVRTAATGALPWIAVTLAVTFGVYGLVRKQTDAGPIVGLAFETWLLAPVAAAYLLWLTVATPGAGSFGDSARVTTLLIMAGPMTALPLLWFAASAKLLRLSTIGILQYSAPSLQFLIAVLAFGEPFTRIDAASFGLIWLGIVLFVAESVRRSRRAAQAATPIPE